MSVPYKLIIIVAVLQLSSCNKLAEYNQAPELESLQHGLKTSVVIGYCASVVMSVVEGQELPDNVTYEKNTGLIFIKIDNEHPLPFNKSIGDIVVAFSWSGEAGLMTILLANIDLLGSNIKLYGLHLVPLMRQSEVEKEIVALLVKQDIIIGNGSDTLLDMSNITDIIFKTKVSQLNSEEPYDAFVAAKQNVWFINVDQNQTYSNLYDDIITVNGGGQIAEVKGSSGGIIYHAMIRTKMNYSICRLNPIEGFSLLQNFKFGGEPYVDLGNSFLSFRNTCDGKAHVEISTGKYITYFNKDISLDLN